MIRAISGISAILAFALAVSATAGTGATAPASPQLSVTSAEAPAGGEVTVSIEGESGDSAIGAFTIDLMYDASVAFAVECSTGLGLCEPGINGNAARFTGISLGGLSGHIDFGDVTFDIVGAPGASTALELQIVDLVDLDSVDLAPVTELMDGEIRVAGGGAAVMGDADCDGEISSADALSILRDVAGAAVAPCGEAGDVDCDGELTSADSLGVLRYVASLPFTAPGGCPPIGGSA